MKRTLAMLLALIMILSCLATATAEGGQMGGARPEQAEGPQGGGQNGSAPQPPEGGQNGSAPQATDRMAPRPTCPHRPA